MKIVKAEAEQTNETPKTETKGLEALVDPNSTQLDKIQSFQNGIRLLALKNFEDTVDEYDLFKIRIANPVCIVSGIRVRIIY